MKATSLLTYIYAVLLMGFYSCTKGDSENKASESTSTKVQTVQVTKASFRSIVPTLKISGKALANKKVVIYAMESGRVLKVYKDLGDKVAKGSVLLLLENPEIEATHLKAVAEQTRAQKIYDRLEASHQKSSAVTPLSIIEEAKSNLMKASADLQLISKRKNELTIKAPFSGTITKRMVEVGATLQNALKNSNSNPLFELQEINPIRLHIDLPGSDLSKISKGLPVQVYFSSLKKPPFQAVISRMANALDPMSNTMSVEIDIPNPSGEIMPGMYAEVDIELSQTTKVLSIQTEAQLLFKKEAYLLVVRNGEVVQLPLIKGASNKNYFEIQNKEITEDDLIIIRGKSLVKNGDKVDAVISTE
jgi:membrane fusion protein, multidrug efflux system